MTINSLGKHSRRHCGAAILFAALCLQPALVQAENDFDLYGDLTITTDYLFRGVSQTMSSPALQGTLSVDHSSGLFGYLWASNVDFTDTGDPDDGAEIEVNALLGYAWDATEHLQFGLSFAQYFYPGTADQVDYDYSEWAGSIAVDGRHQLTVGYSNNQFNSGEDGYHYAAETGFAAFGDAWFAVKLGYFDLKKALGASYGYGEVSLAGNFDFINWRLSYVATTSSAREIFYASTVDPRAVLAVSVSF